MTSGEQDDDVQVSGTHLAQIRTITTAVPEVHVHPADWRQSADGAEYLCRADSVIVRDWHAERVREALVGAVGGSSQLDDAGGTLTRVSWAGTGRAVSVPEAMDRLDAMVGRGVAAPDHLLYVCGVYPCAAVEQLPVPSIAAPFPRPRDVQDEPLPRSGLGAGVKIVVMDTGLVLGAAEDHSWMNGVTGEADAPYEPGTEGTVRQLRQDGGHGTFVAGCLRAVAPGAEVHVVNAAKHLSVQNGSIGAVFETDLARMLRAQVVAAPNDEAAVAVPDIIVLSVAGRTRNDIPPVALTALYQDVLQHIKGLLILSPAGNEGDTRTNWPASFDWVVSVGALAANWRDRASWSSHGRAVDVYAPGDRLVNAYARGVYTYTWDGPLKGQTRTFEGMAMWSGTSFSTPVVAGLVAARMSATGQNSRRAWHRLRERAEQQALPGVGPVLYPGDA